MIGDNPEFIILFKYLSRKYSVDKKVAKLPQNAKLSLLKGALKSPLMK